MEKIKITIPESDFINKKYEGMSYMVAPYISLENKIAIVENYLDSLFSQNNIAQSYFTAEYSLILSIVDLCTNISIDDEDIINKLVSTGLWDDISGCIVNFKSFREDLDKIIALKTNEISLESNANALISKVYELVENISKVDFSENGMKSLAENFGKLSQNVDSLKNTFGDEPEKKGRGRPKKNE